MSAFTELQFNNGSVRTMYLSCSSIRKVVVRQAKELFDGERSDGLACVCYVEIYTDNECQAQTIRDKTYSGATEKAELFAKRIVEDVTRFLQPQPETVSISVAISDEE